MTRATLELGNQIASEIRSLEHALSDLHKVTLFKNIDRSCGYIQTGAETFLAKLHAETIKDLTDKVSAEIKALENEFSSL